MRTRTRLGSLTAVLCVTLGGSRALADEPWLEAIRANTVEIVVTMEDDTTDCGTGYLLDARRLISAGHVIFPELIGRKPAKSYTIITPSGASVVRMVQDMTRWPTSTDGPVPKLDVAIVELTTPVPGPRPRAAIARTDPDELREHPNVELLSFHTGACPDLKQGETELALTISPPRPVTFEAVQTPRAILTGKETPGFSGSPVLSMRFRKVIGVYNSAIPGTGATPGSGYATLLSETDIAEALHAVTNEPLPLALLGQPRSLQVRLALEAFRNFGGQRDGTHYFGGAASLYYEVWTNHNRRWSVALGGSALYGSSSDQRTYYGPVRTPEPDDPIEQEPRDWFHAIGGELGGSVTGFRASWFRPTLSLGLRLFGQLTGDAPGELDSSPLHAGPVAKLSGSFYVGPHWAISLGMAAAYLWEPPTSYEYTGFRSVLRFREQGPGLVLGLSAGGGFDLTMDEE